MILRLRDDVRLEALTLEHADRMLQWMRDPDVADNIGLLREPTAEATRRWIDKAERSDVVYARAIIWSDAHVGNVVFDQIDQTLGTARLSVYIGEPEARGAGVGRAGLHLALVEAFASLALYKVWLIVRTSNASAIRLYDRLGFRIEGLFRDEFLCRGQRESVFRMGLLRDEFQQMTTAA